MKTSLRLCLLTGISFALISSSTLRARTMPPAQNKSAVTAATREEAYRANNLGVALLEQFNHKEGAEAFRRALRLDPQLNIARINLAIALFNVPDLPGALAAAQTAASASPAAPQPHYLLGLIARTQNRTDDAVAAFQRVLKTDPRDTGANVNLGQLYAQQRKYAEAIAVFRVALDAEPYNGTALYNLATASLRGGARDEGQRLMQRFQALRQSGAATVIGQNYLEQGRYAEAVTSTGAEAGLVDPKTPDVTFRDATATTMPAMPDAKTGVPSVLLSNVFGRNFKSGELNDKTGRELALALGGGATLFDFDSDGDLDLLQLLTTGQHLYRNDGGNYVDVTGKAGALGAESAGVPVGAVAGDYDNDARPDLFVLSYGASALYHNDGDGKFSDVTAVSGIPAYPYLSISAALVDADHDGDLDIFIAGLADIDKTLRSESKTALTFPADFAAAPNMLLRNNGDGKFTDITTAANLAGTGGHAVAVVPTDYDNRRDVDLLVVNYDKSPVLFRNLRDTTFRDTAGEVGLSMRGNFTAVAAGDVNKDDFTDFFFASDGPRGIFAMSDGQGRFNTVPAPVIPEAVHAAQFLDYDNDGLLDLVALARSGMRVWRNLGDRWTDVSERAVAREVSAVSATPSLAAAPSRVLASGDVDGDGDDDLVLRAAGGQPKMARNEGGNLNRSVSVRLAGKVSNRSGVGAKIEARAGSLRQKLETYAATPAPAPADLIFGLGARTTTDAVRVLWPAGIVQAETEITPAATAAVTTARTGDAKPSAPVAVRLTVTELDRKPSSCPYLFAWNGERFEFITDFMGGGELGYWVAPGVRAAPDPDEYVRIRGDQLRPRNGRYELRVTNELEEALFMDHLKLVAVAHPRGMEVYPNEGLGNPTSSTFKLYTTRDARPPVAATDDRGGDVLARITRMDRQYPDSFRLHRIRGYADEHALTLNLGESEGKQTLLLLTGWTDYAFSSDNVAAAQSGRSLKPPALQVKDTRGNWKTVIEDIGVPVGRPQTVAVDLTGKFLSASREVRIVTNMRIYWDEILVDTRGGDAPVKMSSLAPVRADLNWRGFSAEATPDGREPFGYNYANVSSSSPWKVFPGRYTREGDVRELLTSVDDMFVVSRPGDEIAVSFDARQLPPLPANWTRTFLLYADGYSKEMDINSASPDRVGQLPFHGMKNYPYDVPEAYPLTPKHRAYVERYNTRVVVAPLPELLVKR